MIEIPEEDIQEIRDTISSDEYINLYLDVGYFLVWHSAVEVRVTALLATASDSQDHRKFDTLCAGVDLRVKIERLRKILKRQQGIGPNLDARLKVMENNVRPIRNRLAHSFLSVSRKSEGIYFASGLSSLPFEDLDYRAPIISDPPISIKAGELLAWGRWMEMLADDLSDAYSLAIENEEFEIVDPSTPLPQAILASSARKAVSAESGRPSQKKK